MGAIKSRVDRLHRGKLGEKARQKRDAERRFDERYAAFRHFLRAFPPEVDTPEVVAAQLDPWLAEIHEWPYLPREAPLLARIACGLNWQGWFPSPLPAAWVRAVLDHPTAEAGECGNCGLAHPSGGYSWKDCRPVFAPPHFPHCLHCGEPMGETESGRVPPSYYQRHNANHPYPAAGLGAFLLAGGDPNRFDPLRGKTCDPPSPPAEPSPSPAAAPPADPAPSPSS